MNEDIDKILAEISKEPNIARLVRSYLGLTILRQDPFQCLLSFICATNSCIPAIRSSLSKLTRRFGKRIEFDGVTHHTFPEPKDIANSSISELRACGVGYRASPLKETSTEISEGSIDLETLRKKDYTIAKEDLMSLPGVGHKVADCVLLFSLDKLEAFPIDVWISRALSQWYPWCIQKPSIQKLSPRQYEIISDRARNVFGRYAGFAQQFLYFHIRNESQKSW